MATTTLPFLGMIQGVPYTPQSTVRGFQELDPYFPEQNLRVMGVTRDAAGNPLAGCNVYLISFALGNVILANSTSDANGNYTLFTDKTLSQAPDSTWMVVAYLPGSPDRAGVTVNTLTGS